MGVLEEIFENGLFKVAQHPDRSKSKNGCTGFSFGPELGTYILLIMVSKLHSLQFSKIFCLYTLYLLSLRRPERECILLFASTLIFLF